MNYFRKVWAIVWKDIRAEIRTKEIFSSMFIFSLLVLVIFNFSIDLLEVNPLDIAQGVLWIAFTFSGILGLNRSFLFEKENDCLQGLMLTPIDRSAIYFGKMLGNLIFMLIMEAIAVPIFVVLFNIGIYDKIISLAIVIILGTLGFVTVGTLFSAMSVNIKAREVMLPILLFPIVVPVIIASVKSTGAILTGKPFDDIISWLKLIAVFDVVFLVVSFLSFEYIIEE
ncbi:MAG: heme exporter protein CcmB [Nitrospinae bacterium]|nr:heme exporter protein CcmB [Nitrospinota bacterium]